LAKVSWPVERSWKKYRLLWCYEHPFQMEWLTGLLLGIDGGQPFKPQTEGRNRDLGRTTNTKRGLKKPKKPLWA